MTAQWSELRRELLELILKKLDLADYARFASVCPWWRSVAVENPPINKPLYFVLSHDPENLVRRFITSFVVPSWEEARFIGALDGWVMILIDRKDLFLLNKGFNSIIPLPPLPDHIDYYFFKHPEFCKAALSSPPPPSSTSGECTVAIKHLYSYSATVFYCRLGSDKSFTKLGSDKLFTKLSDILHFPEDILFYKGRLYVLCDDYYHSTIVIFDHLLNKVSELVTHSLNFPKPTLWLISGNGTLCGVNGEPHEYSVFTLEGNEPRIVRVNNIDEEILLNNRYCSLSLTTKEHKEFRRETDYLEDRFPCTRTLVLDTSKDPNTRPRRTIHGHSSSLCSALMESRMR